MLKIIYTYILNPNFNYHCLRKYLSQIFVIFLLIPFTKVSAKDKESLYTQLNRAIIRLEHTEIIKQENADDYIVKNIPDGTAFFVSSENEIYIVTARHVVEKTYDLHSRVQCINNITGEIEVILLELPRAEWILHDENGDEDTHFVDVAAMKIPSIKDRSVKYFRYERNDSNDYEENQLPYDDPDPPSPILVFGFPSNVGFTLLEQAPLARFGVISMKTDKEFIKINSEKYAEKRCCLIDARMFAGNSGSPVMNEPRLGDSRIRLLGLVIATNNTLDFGIIEPVSRIREVLELAKENPKMGKWSIIPKKEDK